MNSRHYRIKEFDSQLLEVKTDFLNIENFIQNIHNLQVENFEEKEALRREISTLKNKKPNYNPLIHKPMLAFTRDEYISIASSVRSHYGLDKGDRSTQKDFVDNINETYYQGDKIFTTHYYKMMLEDINNDCLVLCR